MFYKKRQPCVVRVWRGWVEKSVWLLDRRWKAEVRKAAVIPSMLSCASAVRQCVYVCVLVCLCIFVCRVSVLICIFAVCVELCAVSTFTTFFFSSPMALVQILLCVMVFVFLLLGAWYGNSTVMSPASLVSRSSCAWFLHLLLLFLINLQGALLLKDPPGVLPCLDKIP